MGKRNNKIIARQVARDYVKELKKNNVPVTVAYVFGSYISGRPNKNSDIDVCIVSPYIKKQWWKGSKKIWALRHEVDARIEPHIFSPDDFVIENPLVGEIKKHGVKV